MSHFIMSLCFLAFLNSGVLEAQTPDFRWARRMGGTGFEQANYVAVDASGNCYVTGHFSSASVSFGATTLTNGATGWYDMYVVKYDAGGTPVWAKSAGGGNNDLGLGIAVDASGNAIVVGRFASTSITFGATTLTNAAGGSDDLYVVKYDAGGNVLWAKSAGGTSYDEATGVGADASGYIYVTGFFSAPGITFGSTTLTSAGGQDMFLVKFSSSGNPVWSRSAGGAATENGHRIAINGAGDCYVTGSFVSTTISFGATTLTNAGGGWFDMFVVKYDGSGNAVWAASSGGTMAEYSRGIAVDASDNVYVTGDFASTSVTFGATTLVTAGQNDVFIVKYDGSGSAVWARSGSGAGYDYGHNIAVDASGNAIATGYFGGETLTFGTHTLTNAGTGWNDIYVVKFDGNGDVLWATSGGGTNHEFLFGSACDASGNSFLVGYFQGFQSAFGATTLLNAGSYDMYILKLSVPPSITSIADIPNDQGGEVRISWNASSEDASTTPAQVTSYSILRRSPTWAGAAAAGKHLPREIAMDSTLNSYDYVASVTALQAAQYQMVVPTLEDSTASGMHRFTYVVVAHNTSLSDHTTSAPDSGYSVDNLSPIPPAGLLAVAQAGPQVELSWSAPVDPDVRSYTVYRSAVAGFTPLPEHVIGTSFSTSFLDASPAAGEVSYYRIVALDIHGNPSPPSGEVAAAVAVTRQFSVAEKWNMVSVPLTVGDYAKSLLFPTATTNAFAYDLGYAAYGILENGRGYWMKFTSDEIVSMSGLVRTLDTVEVAEGWNMVGSVSVPVPVSQIASIPGGIVTGSFFGYHGGYQASATLEPGKGYWVKSTQAGRLILDGTLSTPPANRIRIAESGEMPPPPPQGEAASLIGAPVDYELSQNYPNPFNPRTTIEYALPTAGHVALKVYNALGQEVASLVDGVQEAGRRKAQFDADGLPSGIYICRLTAGTFVEVRKMVLTQ